MKTREITGMRWRVKKISARAAKLLLIQGFLECFRIGSKLSTFGKMTKAFLFRCTGPTRSFSSSRFEFP
jgi:hypothetical protein